MNRILVVEDEDVIRKALQRLLERNNYEVVAVASVPEATSEAPDSFDLILADLRLPGAEGTDLIDLALSVPVIIMTSHASVRSAVESMRLGAIDYISKPFDHDELLLVIERSLRHNRLYAQNSAMKQDLLRLFPHDEIATQSPTMQSVIHALTNINSNDRFIYLHGERGSGKELLARMAHDNSERMTAPLVIADLPMFAPETLDAVLLGGDVPGELAIPIPRMGLVQSAHNGTLIIRNLALLSKESQLKLYTVFVENQSPTTMRSNKQRSVNVRIFALETLPPETARKKGLLIPELAELLPAVTCAVPPLRARREDIESLVSHYLGIYSRRHRNRSITLSGEALNAIKAYDWPGNVTELKNALERAVLSCQGNAISADQLGIGVLDETPHIPAGRDLSLDGYFRYFVLRHQQSLSETDIAQRLGISRKALWERRQRMDLPRP
ncbi:MAG: sigma-54 dependent transcriptional regulator [Granulosicoccus sp.]|nr:sigma-54 dependent transcriptional regulator [Granulosicoccus sp.]